jgi:hypothetical protein
VYPGSEMDHVSRGWDAPRTSATASDKAAMGKLRVLSSAYLIEHTSPGDARRVAGVGKRLSDNDIRSAGRVAPMVWAQPPMLWAFAQLSSCIVCTIDLTPHDHLSDVATMYIPGVDLLSMDVTGISALAAQVGENKGYLTIEQLLGAKARPSDTIHTGLRTPYTEGSLLKQPGMLREAAEQRDTRVPVVFLVTDGRHFWGTAPIDARREGAPAPRKRRAQQAQQATDAAQIDDWDDPEKLAKRRRQLRAEQREISRPHELRAAEARMQELQASRPRRSFRKRQKKEKVKRTTKPRAPAAVPVYPAEWEGLQPVDGRISTLGVRKRRAEVGEEEVVEEGVDSVAEGGTSSLSFEAVVSKRAFASSHEVRTLSRAYSYRWWHTRGFAIEEMTQFNQNLSALLPSVAWLGRTVVHWHGGAALAERGGVLPRDRFYTAETTCLPDAVNLAVGEEAVRTEDSVVASGQKVLSMASPAISAALGERGLAFAGAYVDMEGVGRKQPRMQDLLSQPRGIFLMELFWQKVQANGERKCDYHAVVVNCDRRVVLCNTLGVVPFTAGRAVESEQSHMEAIRLFHVRRVVSVHALVCA